MRFEPLQALPVYVGDASCSCSFSEDFLPEEGGSVPRTSAMPTTNEAADLEHSVHGGEWEQELLWQNPLHGSISKSKYFNRDKTTHIGDRIFFFFFFFWLKYLGFPSKCFHFLIFVFLRNNWSFCCEADTSHNKHVFFSKEKKNGLEGKFSTICLAEGLLKREY